MTDLAFYLLVFTVVGSFFLFIHLVMGHFIRPSKPGEEKLSIYECGEPAVGSAYIQFDLRYYVVALLFVVFDVEVAFLFPWAVVFGTANECARVEDGSTRHGELKALLQPAGLPSVNAKDKQELSPAAAKTFAWIAFLDVIVFFAVLLVGFAYLWKRGDIDWIRTVQAAEAGSQPAELVVKP